MYLRLGVPSRRCGSLARIGRPVVLCEGAMTQLLEPFGDPRMLVLAVWRTVSRVKCTGSVPSS